MSVLPITTARDIFDYDLELLLENSKPPKKGSEKGSD